MKSGPFGVETDGSFEDGGHRGAGREVVNAQGSVWLAVSREVSNDGRHKLMNPSCTFP